MLVVSEQDDNPIQGALGVDTGGTFTDFYLVSNQGVHLHKVLSTPQAPEMAILQGIQELGVAAAVAQGRIAIVHGSTVATNAALEKKGVKTAYVTNRGFKDLLSLARQNRPDIYALNPSAIEPPVPDSLCLEVNCRRDFRGEALTPLSDDEIRRVCDEIARLAPEAVAINFLYSYVTGEDERRIQAMLPQHLFVSCSSDVLPEYKEYERGIATWLNAWLGPKVEGYIQRLSCGVAGAPLSIMQSSGGTIAADVASRKAVNLLLSGPAGGLAAARFIGEQTGLTRLLTFDMGGTSSDVALIDGSIRLTNEGKLAGYPVATPMVDMHTIGAGGGSLAYVDNGGLLHVGPESAGADPGPACYGNGGLQATVTDANVVLGRIRPEGFLGGRMVLDEQAAQQALQQLARAMGCSTTDAALGVVQLANEHMARALRVISVQRGFDPAEFTLCCFGGAGGLHVCALADELSMERVLIPAYGGVLSALGMLVAPKQRNKVVAVLAPLSQATLDLALRQAAGLAHSAQAELRLEGMQAESLSITTSFDCRYEGQSFTLNIPNANDSLDDIAAAFQAVHQRAYGHQLELPIELVNVRVQVEAPPTFTWQDSQSMEVSPKRIETKEGDKIFWRQDLVKGQKYAGPAVICEPVATTYVAPGWHFWCDEYGHIHLQKGG